MRRRFIAGLMLACGLAVGSAGAQSFASKQITIVVPFSAGGPTDTLARILAERMGRTLGQTVIVDNATGAAGTIGVARVVRAMPTAAPSASATGARTSSIRRSIR